MKREWKRGMVARVQYGAVDQIALVRRCARAANGALEFAYVSGGYDMVAEVSASARPLVVIDAEDTEQVERLLDSLRKMSFAAHACGASTCMQAALREFARPTPPRCGAVLSIGGEHYRCDGERDHDTPHGNKDAAAIWGEKS